MKSMAKVNGVRGMKRFLLPKPHPCMPSGVLCLPSSKVLHGTDLKLEKLP